MSYPDVGEYKCFAENEHGTADKVIHLKMADPPTIVEPLKDLVLVERTSGKLRCRVDGYPAPTIKWNKDWRPLAETSRVHVTHAAPDTWTLNVNNAITIDEGQYMIVAENVAGKVQCSARITIEDEMPQKSDIDFKDISSIEDQYYILEEIGRGRHGIVRKVIDKTTGDVFAGKFVRVRDDNEKDFFRTELETSRLVNHKNIVSLKDAYETPKQLIVVNELLTGGPLLDHIVKSGNLTENKAAFYVKQLLEAVGQLHHHSIAHLDIKPCNILLSKPGSDEIRLIDFGFAKKVPVSRDTMFNFGTPEFASPEQIDHNPVTPASDMWSVGVLAYILLSGVSPFRDITVRDTLIKTQDSDWEFDAAAFDKISPQAKDFISKLLVYEPMDRLSVEECLTHPWIQSADDPSKGAKIDVGRLKKYQDQMSAERRENPVRTVANLHSLTKLVEGTPLDAGLHPEADPASGKVSFPGSQAYGEFLDEESWYDWQNRYQPGPESELVPSKDTDYSLRIRGYHRQASDVKESFDLEDDVLEAEDYATPRVPAVRERRLLSDIEKETLPPSLEKEMAWIAEMREKRPKDSDEISVTSKRSSVGSVSTEGFPGPMFKSKLEDMAVGEGETITLCCQMMGPPLPTSAWYRNEELISEGVRHKLGVCDDGRTYLTISNIKSYDMGVYKCVARNKYGRSSCRARLMLGDTPERPGRPVVTQVSSSEAMVIWDSPRTTGNADILYYRLDHKKPGAEKWKTAVKVVTPCAVVTDLDPDTIYRFRVCAVNEFGPSPFSWASVEVTTMPKGKGGITVDPEHNLAVLRARQKEEPPAPPNRWDVAEVSEGLDTDADIMLHKKKPEDVYNLGDVIWKGKFSRLQHCNNPQKEEDFVMKVVPLTKDTESERLREFNVLKGIHHNHIVHLIEGFQTPSDLYIVLEKVRGDNIARHLAFKRRYSEEDVVHVLRQVIDALQFLHRLGYAHLNLQPGSVVMATRQGLHVKLADFSLARKVSPEGESVPRAGYPDFLTPEVVTQDKVSFSADVWGLGVLTFLLLSGESAFSADTDDEVLANIAYNRYNAHDLYENASKEALKFIFKVLKRLPRNRPSLANCLEQKWLQQTDALIKTRSETFFLTNKIRQFVDDYDRRRMSDSFKEDYSKVSLSAKKPVESKRVRKERKPVSKEDVVKETPVTEKAETEGGEKKVKVDDSAEAKPEEGADVMEEKIEEVADDVVSKALEEAMSSSELSSA